MALVRDGRLSIAEVAAKTGRSPVAVAHQRRRGAFDRGNPPAVATTEADKVKYWRERFDDTRRECDRLRSRDNAIRVLVEEIQSLVPTAYSPLPRVSERRSGKGAKGQSQTAHLLLSDSHVGQYVSPGQTLGLGSYSPAQFLRRLKYVEDSVLSICSEHVTTHIDELVVGVLGDMIHGNLQHANEAAHLLPIVDQVVVTSHALAQFLRNVAPKFPKVRVKSVVGNHSRWGDQKKMPTVNRYSSFDTLVYEMARAMLRDIPNIDWSIDEQPFVYYRVYDYAFLAVHGDHLRGGDKALGIPSHAIGREISFNAQVFPGSRLEKTPNYYVAGHLHRPMELPHANGDILYNGGFPGVDNYSFNSKLVPSAPSQKLFLVHPKNGRSATWNLSISRGDDRYADVIPYDVPGSCLSRMINPGS